MNALKHIAHDDQPATLTGDAIDHAGIEPAPTWEDVKAAGLAAWAAFGEATVLTDTIALGRESTDAEEAAYEAASEVTRAATKIMAAFPVTWDQLHDKIDALKAVYLEDEDIVGAIAADLARLKRDAPAPSALLTTASLAQFAACEAEYNRLVALECQVNSTTPEADAEYKRLDDLASIELRKIVEAPCGDLGAAMAKLKWLKLAFTDGETGREVAVAEQIEGYFRALAGVAAPETCPVAALIPDYDRLVAAELNATDADDHEAVRDAGDARDGMAIRIADLKALSFAGAALQAAIAIEFSELARGCEQQTDRDYYQERCERLLISAIGVIGGGLTDNLRFFHTGIPGDAQPIIADTPKAEAAPPFDPAQVIADLEAIGCTVWSLGFSFQKGLTMEIVDALKALTSDQKEAVMAFAARTEALELNFPAQAEG